VRAATSDMMRMPAPEDERVLGLAQIKAAHATDKQVADGKVEEAPCDIDGRGGQAYPSGDAKGLWKACPEIPLPRWGRAFRGMRPQKNRPHSGTSASELPSDCQPDGSADGSKN